MGFSYTIVLVFAIVGSCFAFSADYIPKSYYFLYPDGHRSSVVSLRDKRSIPLLRMRRSDSASSGATSGSFSGSYSGAGLGGDALFFPEHLSAGLEAVRKLSGFPDGIPGFPGGIPAGIPSGIPPVSTYGGVGTGYSSGADGHGNGIAPNLHSRFGGDDGISYSGTAQGARGVYSASSSSIDSDGNVKYSVKTGKL